MSGVNKIFWNAKYIQIRFENDLLLHKGFISI